MSKRNLLIAAVVLVVLAVASQLMEQSDNKYVDENIGKPLMPKNLVESFDEIVLRDPESVVHLRKDENRWVVAEKDGLPADMKQMLELVNNLTTYNVASLITTDEDRLPHFNLVYFDEEKAGPDSSGSQLTLKKSGETIYRLMVGISRMSNPEREGMPPTPDGSYIRLKDGTSVYLIKENLNLETDPNEWVEKLLFSLHKKEVESILFELQGERFELMREEKGKPLVLSDLAETEKTVEYQKNSILNELEEFKVEEIVRKTPELENTLALKAVITVTPYTMQPLRFEIHSRRDLDESGAGDDKDEEKYSYFVNFIKPDGDVTESTWETVYRLSDDWIFQLEEWKAKRWLKNRKDFVEAKK